MRLILRLACLLALLPPSAGRAVEALTNYGIALPAAGPAGAFCVRGGTSKFSALRTKVCLAKAARTESRAIPANTGVVHERGR
jgi:hypothetical protein